MGNLGIILATSQSRKTRNLSFFSNIGEMSNLRNLAISTKSRQSLQNRQNRQKRHNCQIWQNRISHSVRQSRPLTFFGNPGIAGNEANLGSFANHDNLGILCILDNLDNLCNVGNFGKNGYLIIYIGNIMVNY